MDNKLIHNFDSIVSGTNIKRSIFERNAEHKTTFNAGKLIPIFVDEVLPGDIFKTNISMIVRTSTMIKPVMDNSFIDIHFFFVPNRILWDH